MLGSSIISTLSHYHMQYKSLYGYDIIHSGGVDIF